MKSVSSLASALSIVLAVFVCSQSAHAQSVSLKDALAGFASKNRKIRRQSLKQLGQWIPKKLTATEKAQVTEALLLGFKDSDEDIRAESFQIFPGLGQAVAQAHMRTIFQGLTDSSPAVVKSSRACIKKVGASSAQLPFLKSALNHKKWTVRLEAAVLIGRLGDAGRSGLAALVLGTLDSDNDVKRACQNAVAQVGVDESVLPDLTRLLSHKNWTIRLLSVQLIRKLGAKGKPAYGPLLRGLADSDNDVQSAIKKALAGITVDPRILLPLLTDFEKLSNPSKAQVLREINALHSRNQLEKIPGKLVKSVCLQGLQSNSWKLRLQAAKTLGSFGAGGRWSFMTLLQQGKRDSDEDVKKACNKAVAAIGIDESLVPELTTLLKSSSWALRRDAARYLGQLGSKARAAYPALVKIRGDSDEDVRAAVERALKQIGSDQKTLESLVKTFSKQSSKGKEQILMDLAKLAKSGKTMSDKHRRVFSLGLEDSHWSVRRRAAQSLAQFNRHGRWAYVRLLEQSFNDSDEDVRKACVLAIQSIGFNSQHIPQFISLLTHKRWSLRRAAIRSLAQLKASSRVAYPDILNCVADSDEDVRKAAQESLTIIGIDFASWRAILVDFHKLKSQSQLRYLVDLMTLYQQNEIEKPIESPIQKLLTSEMSNKSWRVRQQVCKVLSLMGEQAPWAFIPSIQLSFKDSDSDVQKSAVKAYSSIGAKKSHVPALAELIGSSHWKARALALHFLGSLGNDSKSVLPTVLRALRDSDSDVRLAALKALTNIDPKGLGPTAEKVAGALAGTEEARIKALIWLRGHSAKCEPFIPILMSSLNGKWTKRTRALADTLDKLNFSAEDYEWALRYCSEMCQFWVVHKLGGSTVVRAETKALLKRFASKGKSPRVRAAATKFLGKN